MIPGQCLAIVTLALLPYKTMNNKKLTRDSRYQDS